MDVISLFNIINPLWLLLLLPLAGYICWHNPYEYNSFAATVAAIGGNAGTIMIPNEQIIDDNLIIPSNITLEFIQGGYLNIAAGKTVTINGHVRAGLYQIFAGSRSVVFGTGSMEEVYPQWWGADLSSSDNTTAFQDCFDSLSAIGGGVGLSEGTFLVGALTLHSYLKITGQGWATILQLIDGVDDSLITATSKTGIILADFKIGGNSANQATGGGVRFSATTFSKILQLWIDDCKDSGVYFSGASTDNEIIKSYLSNMAVFNGVQIGSDADQAPVRNLLSKNKIWDCNQNSIYVYAHETKILDNDCRRSGITNIKVMKADRCTVSGNHSSDAGAQGLHFDDCDEFTAEENMCRENAQNGIFIDDTTAECRRGILKGNRCILNTYRGIYNRNGDDCEHIANICYMNDLEGILLNGVEHPILKGNHCKNNSQNNVNTYSGIKLASVNDAVLLGNNCYDDQGTQTQKYGIEEDVGSSYNSFTGNNCRTNATAPFNLLGSNQVIGLNIPPVYGGSVVWDPGNLVDGAGETSAGINIVGAALGNRVVVYPPYDMQDCVVYGYVQAADTVEIRIQNESGGAINFASGTWYVKVLKY